MRRAMGQVAVLGCTLLAGCSALPDSGPDPYVIADGAATVAPTEDPGAPTFSYALVDINERVVSQATDIGPGSFLKSFDTGKGSAPEILVGVGDVVQVTIFESKSGGLFIPSDSGSRPGNFVQLPPQIVDRNGMISVPYAEDIRAAEKTLAEIQREIVAKLTKRAIEPQVVVAMVEQNSAMVSVVGEVRTPTKMRIRRGGERVLDMVAQAGGISFPGYDTYVTLQRKQRQTTVYFNSLVAHPDENIFVAPGDTIYVYREPRRFLAFGANAASGLGASNQFNFEQERVSLAEGVAKAGGLLDDRANPGQIFLYRMEARDVLQAMNVNLGKFPAKQRVIPTIYRANFRDPSSYFFAQHFPMRMKDVIYVSNADSVEIVKFLTFVRSVTSTVSGVASDGGQTRHGIRYLTHGQAPAF